MPGTEGSVGSPSERESFDNRSAVSPGELKRERWLARIAAIAGAAAAVGGVLLITVWHLPTSTMDPIAFFIPFILIVVGAALIGMALIAGTDPVTEVHLDGDGIHLKHQTGKPADFSWSDAKLEGGVSPIRRRTSAKGPGPDTWILHLQDSRRSVMAVVTHEVGEAVVREAQAQGFEMAPVEGARSDPSDPRFAAAFGRPMAAVEAGAPEAPT